MEHDVKDIIGYIATQLLRSLSDKMQYRDPGFYFKFSTVIKLSFVFLQHRRENNFSFIHFHG